MTYVSREELFGKLGIVRFGPDIIIATTRAYELREELLWKGQLENKPHGSFSWHTSFHASEFPGDNPMACDRQALYGMLDIPPTEPHSEFGRAIMDAGKCLEEHIVTRWAEAGILVSGGVRIGWRDGKSCALHHGHKQTGFEDHETWLTCSMDSALDLRPEWPYVTPVEVKGKDHNVVEDMQRGARSWDYEHRSQLMVQVHMCRKYHEEMGWADMGLKPAQGGALLYVSRGRPALRHQFYFEYDEAFVMAGIERNRLRREYWRQGALPPRDPAWRWTEDPCGWCEVKKLCKQDVKDGVVLLGDSNAVKHAVATNPAYSYEASRQAIEARWKEGKDGNSSVRSQEQAPAA